ncbi:MAG: CoA transferase [Bradymonadales bacterium]|nr:CoA transferase [Bradymonadales bacterium]
MANGVLDGIRVIELGRRIAAPLAGMLLAEQGAEVVRIIDRGSQAPEDPVLDALLARGKDELFLDLDEESERAALRDLIGRADVVIENLAEGELIGRGIDLDRIRIEANPGLISCSITPFPPGDPRGKLPDHEAVSGMAGYLYEKPLGKPRYHDFPIGSVLSALFAANGVVAALFARLEHHRGQHIDTALYHANLFSQIIQILVKTGVPRGFLPFKMIGTPFMGPWQCGDGRYIYLHITLPAHNARILEILEEIGYAQPVEELRSVMSEETRRDPSQVKSIPEAKRIRSIYEKVFMSRPAQEWEKLLGQELCCIKIRTIEEWLVDSMAAGMSDACQVEDPVFGQITGPGPAIVAPDHPPIIRPRHVGSTSVADLLVRWEPPNVQNEGKTGPENRIRPGPPLEGIRVLDLSRVIAGPCAARVLAELGAEVLSVQSPSGLDWALSFHLVFNAGKRSVTLDFTDDEGKRKLWAIMEDLKPHAFIQNYRHLDIARAIGVDPEAMRGRFPEIVYTHLNAYGNEGVWQNRPGFEQVVQAVSGIQVSYAGGGPPRLVPTPVIDIGSGLLGAFATLLGLVHQRRTGQGLFATTHLTQMSVLFQIGAVAEFQRERCLQSAHERGAPVEADPQKRVVGGIVRARDRYACLVGHRGEIERWLDHAGLAETDRLARKTPMGLLARWRERPRPGGPSGLPGPQAPDPVTVAARWMWTKPLSHWQRSLETAGVADSVLLVTNAGMRQLTEEIRRFDSSPQPVVRKRDYPGCPTPLTFVASPIRMSLTPVVDVSPPPQRGEHTRQVLAHIGVQVPEGTGVIPYPGDKPLLVWLSNLVRWGYFAWRSGNI